MANKAVAAFQILPIFLYHTLAYALILLGAYALIEDGYVVNDACGKQYHLFKFCGLNLCLWVFACFGWSTAAAHSRTNPTRSTTAGESLTKTRRQAVLIYAHTRICIIADRP